MIYEVDLSKDICFARVLHDDEQPKYTNKYDDIVYIEKDEPGVLCSYQDLIKNLYVSHYSYHENGVTVTNNVPYIFKDIVDQFNIVNTGKEEIITIEIEYKHNSYANPFGMQHLLTKKYKVSVTADIPSRPDITEDKEFYVLAKLLNTDDTFFLNAQGDFIPFFNSTEYPTIFVDSSLYSYGKEVFMDIDEPLGIPYSVLKTIRNLDHFHNKEHTSILFSIIEYGTNIKLWEDVYTYSSTLDEIE